MMIRTAVAADRPALQQVYRDASLSNVGDAPLLLARPEYLIFAGEGIADGRTFVAVIEERIVGFATIAGDDELEDLFVDPAWRRRGIARRLVEAVAGVAKGPRLWVTGNPHALGFYLAAGFAEQERIATTLGTGLRMSLDLV
jgi:GNAT superfamily N-acetyltransferase